MADVNDVVVSMKRAVGSHVHICHGHDGVADRRPTAWPWACRNCDGWSDKTNGTVAKIDGDDANSPWRARA